MVCNEYYTCISIKRFGCVFEKMCCTHFRLTFHKTYLLCADQDVLFVMLSYVKRPVKQKLNA